MFLQHVCGGCRCESSRRGLLSLHVLMMSSKHFKSKSHFIFWDLRLGINVIIREALFPLSNRPIGVNVSVCVCLVYLYTSALWWNGDLSRVTLALALCQLGLTPASTPGSCTDERYSEWMDGRMNLMGIFRSYFTGSHSCVSTAAGELSSEIAAEQIFFSPLFRPYFWYFMHFAVSTFWSVLYLKKQQSSWRNLGKTDLIILHFCSSYFQNGGNL